MISIITAIYNGLPVNRIFFEYLKKNTFHPFQLIIIDNGSTDGSAEFFEQAGAQVIRNPVNYSYPYCQNQGIRAAKYDIFAFLNNDIIVPPLWDKHIIETAQANGLEVLTSSGLEQVESIEETQILRRKWKRIKNLISLFGTGEKNLRMMHRLMYGNWEAFSNSRWQRFGTRVKEGIVGHSVIMYRSALDKIGYWDERLQAADFDIYIRSKKRSLEVGDIKPVHLALGILNHHFIRITAKSKPPAFDDRDKIITLEEKWGNENIERYLAEGFFR